MPSPVVRSYRLTPIQQGMLFHHLQEPNRGVDIEQMVGHLRERLDLPALTAAWQAAADRHDILRTRFRWVDQEEPVQEVLERVDVVIRSEDLRSMDADAQRDVLADFMRDDRLRGFDLAEAPAWRLTTFALADDRYEFVFTYHHSLLDTSVVWVMEEAFVAYDAAVAGRQVAFEPRAPYEHHIRWLDEHLRTDRDAARSYYRQLLAGYDEPAALTGLERPVADRPSEPSFRHDRFSFGEAISEGFHRVCRERGIGPAVLVEAAWALVLGAFSGSSDVVFGSTRGCRRTPVPGADRIMGLFINTPPVRLSTDPTETVGDLLDRVRAQRREKQAHEHTALTDVQAVSEVSGAPLFETIVVVNDLHQGTRLKQLGGAFEHRDFDLHDQTNFPLNLLLFADPIVHAKLSYDDRRFDPARIGRLRELLVAVVGAMVADTSATVASLPRLPPGDLERLDAWNATARDVPRQATMSGEFEAQVDRDPDRTAIVFRDQRLTYRELDRRSNRLASTLRSLGVGPDSLVGVYIDRSVSMMVALLGVLKAGGAYVPMDPAYPAERIAMMLEDCHADVVLTSAALRATLPASGATVVAVDEVDDGIGEDRIEPLHGSGNLAYVIFTSGSTGRPKGVMIEHHNVVNFFVGMDEALHHDPSAEPGVWLAVTSISFDISVLELFWTLSRGYTVVLQEDEGRLVGTIGSGSSAGASATVPMAFSLFYFASDAAGRSDNRYRLLIEGAKFADTHGFSAVWTPERHFHQFGGDYPNPAVTSAAVAMVTERVSIRAGSVVLPLHNPIRCAEDWSIVDNLSNGRVGLSFASGWHADDFVLAPDNFTDRRAIMAAGIETVRALWRGETVTAPGGDGRPVTVSLFPPPVQTAPPVWITAGGSADTFAMAGRIGANILTNLLVMNRDELVANVANYRAAYAAAGHPGSGHVTVMLHTFVGTDEEQVRAIVREPFLEYLRTSTDLINRASWERTSFAKPAGAPGRQAPTSDLGELTPEEMDAVMDHAFERYVTTAGLFGTPERCVETVRSLAALGVDEIACLIDFGVDEETVLAGLESLDALRRLCEGDPSSTQGQDEVSSSDVDEVDTGLVAQIARHGVTHLQCTPSHAAIIAGQPDGLAALTRLRQLLVGGEALPAALVDRIRPQMRGELFNMYGPTETTIWSTVSPILSAARAVTIGRPIANTTVLAVDRFLQPVPIGVAGELVIGGEGVVRGYLDRPELTAERFVHVPAAEGAVMYRTGDLVRFRDDGEIEFAGRLDHQVKIRGYRIELGEIETAIGRRDDVADVVVVARTDEGDPRLVAYVVAASEPSNGSAQDWGQVWNQIYDVGAAADGESAAETDRDTDGTFALSGWNDSYTGEPIPSEHMREWVDQTVGRIMDLHPRRVLEIGCGTGLLLFRVAPQVERYVGIDVAQNALDRIERQLQRTPVPQVSLRRGVAQDLGSLVDETFDTVVLNSVAQYFPDAQYLVDVIDKAMAVLEPGGTMFVGDVRSLAHLPLFAASVELARAADDTPVAELQGRIDARIAAEEELVVDPAFFEALRSAIPSIAGVDVVIKAGRHDNEMTRYRYDVVLTKSTGDLTTVAAAPDTRTTGHRNDRLVRDVELVRLLSAGAAADVAGVRAALQHVPSGERVADLDLVPGHHTIATWSPDALDRFDVVVRSAGSGRASASTGTVAVPSTWTAFTNTPVSGRPAAAGLDLRASLRATLPEHMIPSAFVFLDALPRTPNGKIDRKALPAPSRGRVEDTSAAQPPANDLERVIADMWQELLQLERVGVDTNVFDLGANSLMMVSASIRLTERIGRRVSLVELFRYPTVRTLSDFLGGGTDAAQSATDGDQRGQSRRAGMQRQRDLRQRSRRERSN